MEDELPESPTEAHECARHYSYANPARSGSGLCTTAISTDVFGELDPIVIVNRSRSALAQRCVEPVHPGGVFKAESAKVAADDSLTEDPAGEFGVVARFQSLQMTDRYFRYCTDGLERNLPSLALQPQLVAESFHSAPLNVLRLYAIPRTFAR